MEHGSIPWWATTLALSINYCYSDFMDTKICKTCLEEKSKDEFYEKSAHCKSCRYIAQKDNPKRIEHLRKYRSSEKGQIAQRQAILKKYSLTIEDYDRMLEEQGGVCKICKRPERRQRQGKTMYLSVDHCHTTLRNRGLLCDDCNVALGRVNDDVTVLKAMIAYLEAE